MDIMMDPDGGHECPRLWHSWENLGQVLNFFYSKSQISQSTFTENKLSHDIHVVFTLTYLFNYMNNYRNYWVPVYRQALQLGTFIKNMQECAASCWTSALSTLFFVWLYPSFNLWCMELRTTYSLHIQYFNNSLTAATGFGWLYWILCLSKIFK